jgi:hypothetical protein
MLAGGNGMHGRTYVLIVLGIVTLIGVGIAVAVYMHGGGVLSGLLPALHGR